MPTVQQWVKHLSQKIEDQRAYFRLFERRYENKYVLPFIQREYAEVYGADAVNDVVKAASAIRPPRTGTAGIVIDAIVERLTVLGAGSDDPEVAALVERAWEDNDLDVMHREAHRESLIKARSFAQVTRSADGEKAIVGIDAPDQMAVHRQAAPPYDVDAALKITTDEWTAKRRARLWLPGRDLHLVEGAELLPDPEGGDVWSRWVVTRDEGSRLPGVPVVEFAPRSRLLKDPVSEIEPIETLVDIADLIEGLMVFAGHFGAVPIRWGVGLSLPRDPKDPTKPLLGPDGKPVLGFNARADRFWGSTEKDARFGQLEPASLESFVAWAEHSASRIRAKTGVASTYFSLDLKSHMSAELLKTDEAPMVRRIRALGENGAFGQAWRRVMRYIVLIESPGSVAPVRSRWEDPGTRIESQSADIFAKTAPHLGARIAAEQFLGWSPALAARAVEEVQRAKLLEAAADPLVGLGRSLMGGSGGDAGG